ncbi:MAG TPA: aldo/keto reductase [Phycisphaerae bacterium]|nr:aldo/keto reductase [Phycisphaerae bacterium]
MPTPTLTPTRTLGNSDLTVRPFCLGGNVFGWTIDEPTSFQILDAFLNAGFNFIDTADVYSKWKPGNTGGESETILGKWFKARNNRAQVILATKVGMEMPASNPLGGGKGLAKTYILKAAEASLKRLQTDYIDLYQSHQDDPATPLEETLDAYQTLIKQGKVRVIGASNYTADRLEQVLTLAEQKKLPRYDMLQPHYNLVERHEFESTLRPVCLRHNVGVIPYFSLASGFLTGKYRSEADLAKSARGKSAAKYLNDRGLRVLAALDAVAKRHNSTPAQVALAWLSAQPTIVAPIASATSLTQLHDLLASTKLLLDDAALTDLNRASD